ncbi:MAG: AAA family ATPase [Rhodocyclaceae bacterium]|nr:AAA family ATPase [Rhodocyclaceae bacterium]
MLLGRDRTAKHSQKFRQYTVWLAWATNWAAYVGFFGIAARHFPYDGLQPFFLSWGYDSWWTALASIVTVGLKLLVILVAYFALMVVAPVVVPILLLAAAPTTPVVLITAATLYALPSLWGERNLKNSQIYLWISVLSLLMLGLLASYYAGPDQTIVRALAGLGAIGVFLGTLARYGLKYEESTQPSNGPAQNAVKSANDQRESNSQAGENGRQMFEDRFPVKSPRTKFEDVVGMRDFKTRLLVAGREVVESQRRKALAERKPARNGILLFGAAGNGKTMFAEALAGELALGYIYVTFGDIASRWVGQTTEVAMSAFDVAEKNAPCLLFMDEIDSILGSRNQPSASHEHTRTVNAILTRLVDIRDKGVVVVGATNYVDSLDAAAIREGRFDFKIEVPPPDELARVALLTNALEGATVTFDADGVKRAARRWAGFSAARLRAIAEEAGRTANAEKTAVDFMKLTDALRRIQGRTGYRFTEKDLTLDDLVLSQDMRKKLSGLADRMIHIEEIEELGGSVPSGVLYYGPPGGGKTVAAKALAKTAQWAFISVSGQDLVNDTTKVDKTVELAADLRPCVIMIDEAEDVLGDRSMGMNSTLTNKLLAAIDGAGGKTPDVLWIAATNHPDSLDPAALRGGRFTEKVEFPLPDEAAIKAFVAKWKAETKAQVSPEVTSDSAALLLQGLTYANLRECLQTAINTMIGRRAVGEKPMVTLADIETARNTLAV